MFSFDPLLERAWSRGAPLVWQSDVQASFVHFNSAWLVFTGIPPHEAADRWPETIHPEDLTRHLARQRDHFHRRVPYESRYRLRRADGVYRRVLERGAPSTDASGSFAGFFGTCLDIHDLQAPPLASPEIDFFELSLDNLCVTGFDGYFRRVNPSWTRTLGWTAAELLSRPVSDFMHPEDREKTLAARQRLHDGLEMGPLENRYLCKDGSYRWFEWRSVARVEHGLVYAAARDITEKKCPRAVPAAPLRALRSAGG
jgi:PAS domain S-box-containing protein